MRRDVRCRTTMTSWRRLTEDYWAGAVAVLFFLFVQDASCAQMHHTHLHTPEPHAANITVKRHYNNHNHQHKHKNKDSKRTYAPQLSKHDKEYLGKLEDALQSKKGRMLYTNSWAVQLNPAEVAQADRIAEKHGFENLGQVSLSSLNHPQVSSIEWVQFHYCRIIPLHSKYTFFYS